MAIQALRTPEDRFADLPDFGWSPEYIEDLPGSPGLRMAYLDVRPDAGLADAPDAQPVDVSADVPVVLCLHGEPTWGFLYRKMIPVLRDAGHRVVVPDLFGFGRSDKPVHGQDYTFDFHRTSLLDLVDALGLTGVTLVVQDWGGLLGLTLPVDRPDLVARLLVMNTALGVGTAPGPGFEAWRAFVASQPDLDIAALMRRAVPGLTDAEAAAYAAPFPGPEYKAGVRMFPQLVPTSPSDPGADVSRAAAQWWSTRWEGPTFMAVGELDPVLGPPVMASLRRTIRGCPEPLVLAQGHFVQESGDVVARAALEAWGGTGATGS